MTDDTDETTLSDFGDVDDADVDTDAERVDRIERDVEYLKKIAEQLSDDVHNILDVVDSAGEDNGGVDSPGHQSPKHTDPTGMFQ